jgi:hypothetical protein
MVTLRAWYDFLYDCDLCGQQWLHINRVGQTYIFWRAGETSGPFAQAIMDAFLVNPEAGEETLAKFLAEAHYGAGGVVSNIPEESKQRITKMLHYIVSEKPDLSEWVN